MIRRSFRFGLWMGVLAALIYAATRSRQRELPTAERGTTAEPWPPVQPATDRFPSASPAEAPAPATAAAVVAPDGEADDPVVDEVSPGDEAVAAADELSTREGESDQPVPVDDPTDLAVVDDTEGDADETGGDVEDGNDGEETAEWAASDLPMSRPVRKARPPRKRKAPARRRLRAKRRAALEDATGDAEPTAAADEGITDVAADDSAPTGTSVDAAPDAADVEAEPAPAPRKRKAAAKKAAAASVAWVEPSDGACPDSHPVKANMDSKIFHVPGGLSYERTNAHRCYESPDAATGDGLRQAKR